ncbi:MAG: zf-HC2 domain-containing protein [Acidobacteriota bacterium]
MTTWTCAAVRERLQNFYDGELAVPEQIAVEGHVRRCEPCAGSLDELRALGAALRLAAAPAPSDDWRGVRSGVISRIRAEAHESVVARARRAFDDMHLVWIALASTAGTCICAAAVLSMLHFASSERGDSLAGMITVMGAPSGSNLNPARLGGRIQAPSVPEYGVVYATLERSIHDDDRVLPLSAVVTREGRVASLELLSNDPGLQEVTDLVDALSRGRLEPAQSDGGPIAVNLVWLVAHTTVRGKSSS